MINLRFTHVVYVNSSFLFIDSSILLYKYTTIVSIYLLEVVWSFWVLLLRNTKWDLELRKIIFHSWGKTLLCTLRSDFGSWGFLVWLMGTGTIPSPVWTLDTSVFSTGSFPGVGSFSHLRTDQYSLSTSRAPSAGVCSYSSLLARTVLCAVVSLGLSGSSARGVCRVPPAFLPLCSLLDTLSRGNTEAIAGIPLIASFLSGTTALWLDVQCLKNFCFIYFICFLKI